MPAQIFTLIIIVFTLLSLRSISLDSWTFDEGLHLKSAKEWLYLGHSPTDRFNPPLSKLPTAFLYLLGFNFSNDPFLVFPRLTTVIISIVFLFIIYFWT